MITDAKKIIKEYYDADCFGFDDSEEVYFSKNMINHKFVPLSDVNLEISLLTKQYKDSSAMGQAIISQQLNVLCKLAGLNFHEYFLKNLNEHSKSRGKRR